MPPEPSSSRRGSSTNSRGSIYSRRPGTVAVGRRAAPEAAPEPEYLHRSRSCRSPDCRSSPDCRNCRRNRRVEQAGHIVEQIEGRALPARFQRAAEAPAGWHRISAGGTPAGSGQERHNPPTEQAVPVLRKLSGHWLVHYWPVRDSHQPRQPATESDYWRCSHSGWGPHHSDGSRKIPAK